MTDISDEIRKVADEWDVSPPCRKSSRDHRRGRISRTLRRVMGEALRPAQFLFLGSVWDKITRGDMKRQVIIVIYAPQSERRTMSSTPS